MVLLPIIWDMAPIVCILYTHHRNFKKEVEQVEQEEKLRQSQKHEYSYTRDKSESTDMSIERDGRYEMTVYKDDMQSSSERGETEFTEDERVPFQSSPMTSGNRRTAKNQKEMPNRMTQGRATLATRKTDFLGMFVDRQSLNRVTLSTNKSMEKFESKTHDVQRDSDYSKTTNVNTESQSKNYDITRLGTSNFESSNNNDQVLTIIES
jgi:hypothetical protein